MSPPPAVATHGLAAPTVADFRTAVQKACPADHDAVWARLCSASGTPATASAMTLDELAVLATAVTASPGVLGIMGRSLSVRLSSYRTLTALNGATR